MVCLTASHLQEMLRKVHWVHALGEAELEKSVQATSVVRYYLGLWEVFFFL